MPETIEVEVGTVYAQLHESLQATLGERYENALREELEDWIHERNKELERTQEQAMASAEQPEPAEPDADGA
jgi:hypothetical protein